MSKKPDKLSKKRTRLIIIIVILVILLLGGGAYYAYSQSQQRQAKVAEQKKAVSEERKKLDSTSFRGDRDLAAQYVEATQANNHDAASQLYEQAVAKTNNKAEKIELYEQAVTIANQTDQIDQALQFAIKLSELSNAHRASANVAYIYGLNKDSAHQKEYLQKAIDQLASLPTDSAEYTDFMAYYKDMLAKLGAN